jgi:hypothetical protein
MSTSHRYDSRGSNPAGRTTLPVTTCAMRCQCRAVQGVLANPARSHRVVCYCHDCQAFAHVLGQTGRVLDHRGGTDVVQTLPRNLTVTAGHAHLACLRLTPRGMLRWYASCCSTPIGNTLASAQFSFVGLIRACLDPGNLSPDETFGPVTAWSSTAGARGDPKPRQRGRGRMAAFVISRALRARLTGDFRQSPFFDPQTGAPVATPRVLSSEEHERVMAAVRQA